MTWKVGICDDNPLQVELIKKYVRKYDWKDDLCVLDSTNPDDFLDLVKATIPHVVFLDIDMGKVNGIDLGEAIRKIDKNIVIVFITAYEKYAYEAYQTRAFHYLMKTILTEEFNEVLDEVIAHIKLLNTQLVNSNFVVKTKKETVCFECDDIYYFEKIGHKIRVCAESRDVFFYDNFCTLIEVIDPKYFVRCHQGYIVNIGKVRGLKNKTLFLSNDFELPVSRTYMSNIRLVLNDKLFSGR